MSGPIVRSGASPEFSKNWDNIFAKPSKTGTAGKAKKNAKANSGTAAPAKAAAVKGAKAKPAAKKAAASKAKKTGKK